jgi:hypothetical protein
MKNEGNENNTAFLGLRAEEFKRTCTLNYAFKRGKIGKLWVYPVFQLNGPQKM